MTPEQELQIRERERKATAGPWAWTEDRYTEKKGRRMVKVYPLLLQALYEHRGKYRDAWDDQVFTIGWPMKKSELVYGISDEDKVFIAHAREDISLLLAEIDRLRTELQGRGLQG